MSQDKKIPIYISSEVSRIAPEIMYVLKLWSINTNSSLITSPSPDNAVLIGSKESNPNIIVSDAFLNSDLRAGSLNNKGFFEHGPGALDFLATAFFMVNSLQEYGLNDYDSFGRFKFTSSYQWRLRNASENVVQQCFDGISELLNVKPVKNKTRFFLTHDIDSVYGSIYEDGFNVIKRGRFDLFLKLLFQLSIGKPEWLNIDQIMKLESEHDCRSVFYWIVNQGRINAKEINADYHFASKRIQKLFNGLAQNGFENGLHKSLVKDSFESEIGKFGQQPSGNRYHYLKFNLPGAYEEIERALIPLDTSLGFSESIGFRNSYGLPFSPYNLNERRPFNFVEAPLHVMDRTFFHKKAGLAEVEKELFSFFDKHRENCVLTILWHNNFFSNFKYKGYLGLYKKILVYILENDLKTILTQEIVHRYSMERAFHTHK